MSDYHDEPSYYEIALTNRQVLVAFVILLGCLVVAFLSGVWVGRGPVEGAVTQAADASPGPEPPEEMSFFADTSAPAPDLAAITDDPSTETTLAEDLGLTEGAPSAEAPAPTAKAPSNPDPPPRQEAPAPPPQKAPAASGVAPAEPLPSAQAQQETLIIQVFSSRDQNQAGQLVKRMVDGGYKAFLSPVEVDGSPMYRVRIGPFQSRPEAEDVASRVRRQFKVDTWITSP